MENAGGDGKLSHKFTCGDRLSLTTLCSLKPPSSPRWRFYDTKEKDVGGGAKGTGPRLLIKVSCLILVVVDDLE